MTKLYRQHLQTFCHSKLINVSTLVHLHFSACTCAVSIAVAEGISVKWMYVNHFETPASSFAHVKMPGPAISDSWIGQMTCSIFQASLVRKCLWALTDHGVSVDRLALLSLTLADYVHMQWKRKPETPIHSRTFKIHAQSRGERQIHR